MRIEVEIKGKIPLNLKIEDIIKEINKLRLIERWQIVAKILNNINLKDIEELEAYQLLMIRNFLETQNKYYGKEQTRKIK